MIPILEKSKEIIFTSIEKEIATYVEDHMEEIPYLNLEDISKSLFTSNATVVRFCKKFGLSGFNEFKYQVKKELQNLNRDSASFEQFMIDYPLALFSDNMAALDFEEIQKVVNIICSSMPLYIHGRSLSAIAAKYLQRNLVSLDRPCILVSELHLLRSLSSRLYTKSAIIIMSAKSPLAVYQEVVKNAKKDGHVIILMTNTLDSELLPLCDIVLISNDKNETYQNVDVNSRLGMVTIAQVIIEMMHFQKQSQNKKQVHT